MRCKRRVVMHLLGCGVIFASWGLAQETSEDESFQWLPAHCAPLETIGFHDEPEVESEPVEAFTPVNFKSTPFTLRENETFGELLADEDDVSLYVTMAIDETNDEFEFSCRNVLGANREPGLSCVNTPPSDILMLNPKSMRFSRAAIGSWTFQSNAALREGSSLFVELGQCYSLATELDSN